MGDFLCSAIATAPFIPPLLPALKFLEFERENNYEIYDWTDLGFQKGECECIWRTRKNWHTFYGNFRTIHAGGSPV
jgi:hypothetical protein